MRMPRLLARRPRPAAILAAGLATTLLGTAAVFSPVTANPQASPAHSTPLTTVTDPAGTPSAVTESALADAYNKGWMEGEDDLMATDCKTRIPTDVPQTGDPLVDSYNAGWHDGRVNLADSGACEPENLSIAPGDDNRDGIVDEDESGWDCHTMGNRQCGPQGDASPAQR
ncbi:hypothetical protein ACFYU4_37865 [Streptomyces tendae]|uniref:hypothetical protein n=1 Tax=Streptomyces tendae TaxID=1932 RepID=UPI003697C7E1